MLFKAARAKLLHGDAASAALFEVSGINAGGGKGALEVIPEAHSHSTAGSD